MTTKTTKPRCVLLDANVIIKAHEVDVWQELINKYELIIPSIVVRNEAQYFRTKQKKKYPINLAESLQNREIQELGATVEDLASVQAMFANWFVEILDPGETEALALLKAGKAPDAYLCTSDGPAIEALAMIDMAERGISMEMLLGKIGLQKNLDRWFKEDNFRRKIIQGQQNRIRDYGLTTI